MKTPLGTEVYLGQGHIVLNGGPSPPAKGAQHPPLFSAHVYCGHGPPSQVLLSSFYRYCILYLVLYVVLSVLYFKAFSFYSCYDTIRYDTVDYINVRPKADE